MDSKKMVKKFKNGKLENLILMSIQIQKLKEIMDVIMLIKMMLETQLLQTVLQMLMGLKSLGKQLKNFVMIYFKQILKLFHLDHLVEKIGIFGSIIKNQFQQKKLQLMQDRQVIKLKNQDIKLILVNVTQLNLVVILGSIYLLQKEESMITSAHMIQEVI